VYGVERRAKKLTNEERLAMRKEESRPQLDKVFDWCRQHKEKYLPKAPFSSNECPKKQQTSFTIFPVW